MNYGTRRSLCDRKVRYETWGEAEEAALAAIEREPRSDAQAYGCGYCGGWHYGHPPRVSRAPLNVKERARKSWEAWNR